MKHPDIDLFIGCRGAAHRAKRDQAAHAERRNPFANSHPSLPSKIIQRVVL